MTAEPLVLDASVAVKILLPEADSGTAVAVVERHPLLAPDFIFAECAHVLGKAVNRGLIEPDDAFEGISALDDLQIALHPSERLATDALRLAVELRHSAYDWFYLALALQTGCRLLTADQRLVSSAAAFADHLLPLAQPVR